MQKILEIQNATVYRGSTRVFHNLSLEIGLGCHTVILGPNGSGKSTLLKLLLRELYPLPHKGSYVRIFGQERWNVWELRSRLGIVSQDLQHQYLGHVPGLEVLLSGYSSSMGLLAHQKFSAKECRRARQIMEFLEIEGLQERPFATLSTGEQRRFLLGRALIHDPEALILDEPTSGLDLKACFQYLEVVRSLIRQGKTLILVTHHIHEIPPEVRRVVFLKEGKIVADGEKTALMTGQNLSSLFSTPLSLVRLNGFYQVLPKD